MKVITRFVYLHQMGVYLSVTMSCTTRLSLTQRLQSEA